MARNLYIYKGITPNIENGAFLVGGAYEYICHLQPYLLKTIALNNYRINTDVVKVKLTSDFDELQTHNITYLIDANIEEQGEGIIVNYFRAYMVNSFKLQSDMIIFNITIDLWATYHNDASIKNVLITRSNRAIGKGYYDDITKTYTQENFLNRLVAMGGIDGTQSDYGVKYINESEVNIVFLAKVVTARNTIGTDIHSITQLFCVNIADIRTYFEAIQNLTSDITKVNGVSLAIDLISHIYSLDDPDLNYNIEIIRAWVVTDAVAHRTATQSRMKVKSKPFYADHADMSFWAYFVQPSHIVETKELTGVNYDIDYKYFAGSYGDGIELKNEVNNNFLIELEYCVTESDMQITIMQGDKQKDITSAFEVSLSGQSQVEDKLHKVARWAHNIGDMISFGKNAVSNGMATQGVGALLPFSEYVIGLTNQFSDARPSGTIAKGGGACTFAWSLSLTDIANHKLNYPYYFTRFKSVFDEKKKARRYGAQFMEHIPHEQVHTLLSYINTFNLLGEDNDFNTTFVAFEAYIEGVPLEAVNFLRNLFHNGVYLIAI